jgi:diacylglycerol kinase family enzyme
MLILVNKSSNGGRAAERWARVEPGLRGLAFETHVTATAAAAERLIAQTKHDVIVAAGGDGTVNSVLNAVMRLRPQATLGAIGLGSSNDFHKPFDEMVSGVPVRIGAARLVDVGRATIVCDGVEQVRYFCLNASVGLVADGNAFFNTDDPTLLWLKRRNVDAAIAYTAFVNLLRFRPVRARLRLDGAPARTARFASLGVLKKVHFAGGMRYDTPVTADDGLFDVNLWERTQRVSVVRTLASLSRGRFRGLPGARCWRARSVRIEPERPVHLELDGEVTKVTSAELVVVPKALKVCS